jgi:enoyl-CoA hydratase/carnithine racemase
MTEMNLDTKFVTLTVENNVGIITLNNPPLNVLNRNLLMDLDRVLDHLENDQEAKVIVLTGAGPAFAAGADIKAMPALNGDTGEQLALSGQAVFNKLENMDKVSIAAINGVALGGGLELAMSCDIRIISDKAKVGQPEINLGIIPGYGGTQRLARLIGKPRAKELILTGDTISAQEALALGIADKLTTADDLLRTALSLAGKIASKGQVAVRNAKKAIDRGYEQTLEEGLKTEAKCFGTVCGSEDKNEGVLAFMEKRAPQFKDK